MRTRRKRFQSNPRSKSEGRRQARGRGQQQRPRRWRLLLRGVGCAREASAQIKGPFPPMLVHPTLTTSPDGYLRSPVDSPDPTPNTQPTCLGVPAVRPRHQRYDLDQFPLNHTRLRYNHESVHSPPRLVQCCSDTFNVIRVNVDGKTWLPILRMRPFTALKFLTSFATRLSSSRLHERVGTTSDGSRLSETSFGLRLAI